MNIGWLPHCCQVQKNKKMTATTDLDQRNRKNLGFSAKENRSVKKRRKKQQQKPARKRQTFQEAWNNAVRTDADRKAKQHYAWTENEAFNELVKRFGENFFEVIEKSNTAINDWKTRQDITPPRNLWELYQDRERIVGLRFGLLTRILLLDLDEKSPTHPLINKAEFDRLLLTLEQMGLARYQIIRSSDSGGLHIVIALDESVPTWMCAKTLYVALTQAGFKIGNGILELFPNCKHYNPNQATSYLGIRLPLQPESGSVVLDPVTLEPIHADLDRFVRELAHDAQYQDMETFKRLMRVAYDDFRIDHKGRVKTSMGRAAAWKKDLLERIAPGFTGSGQTNDLIMEIGKVVFVFQKLDGQAAVDAMVNWVKSLPGYAEHCHHQHEIERRCWDWHKCITKLYYKYDGTFQERVGIRYGETIAGLTAKLADGRSQNQANATRQQAARQRLAATIRTLRDRIRQGLAAPATMTGWIQLMIATAKELFEQGFSVQFLYQFKRLLGRLLAFAMRVTRRAGGTGESASVDPTGTTEAPPEPVVPPSDVVIVADVTPPSVATCATENTDTTESEKTLEPASEAALLATSASGKPPGNAETRSAPAITGNSAIYEGQGGNYGLGSSFPYVVGQQVRFQHETFEGWRKGTVVQVNWESGYFVNCLIKFNAFVKLSRYAPGQWVERVIKLYNQTWLKPYPAPS
jgi:hypothetical protein